MALDPSLEASLSQGTMCRLFQHPKAMINSRRLRAPEGMARDPSPEAIRSVVLRLFQP